MDRTKIGCTEIASRPDAKVLYYIDSDDDSGRSELIKHTESEDEIMKVWKDLKEESNFDAQLFVALVVDMGEDGFELVDNEVVDAYIGGADED